MELKYSERAVEDLYKIVDFIALDSPDRALAYIKRVRSKIEILKTFPNLGVTCQSKKIEKDCRVMIYESYLIFYTVEPDSVTISNIINSATDYTA